MSCTPPARAAATIASLVASGSKRAMFCGDCAIEQLDVLRQVADVAAERLGLPLIERGAVEANRSPLRQPGADESPRERRLAGRGRADDAKARPPASERKDAP